MFMRDSVDILAPTQSGDTKGRVINSYAIVRTIKGQLQPLKKSVLFQEMGITDLSTHLLFCKDTAVTVLNRFIVSGVVYRITNILLYHNHSEVYAERVV